MDHYCLNCMHNIAEETGICPVCGHGVHVENRPHQLTAGTMLRGRYLVGRVLGQGGFGITYIGRDTFFDEIAAIKEYYPNRIITRDSRVSTTVAVTGKEGSEFYSHGLDKFLDEAKVLRKFKDENGIVGVSDFFRENGTAYIVMEYLNGTTLKKKIQESGPMTADELLPLMRPVIEALDGVHRGGIVHRDISPDNIMLMPDGSLRLLDFGAARAATDDYTQSVILKPGFAPAEQYRKHGVQGPETDIYALCATLYYCLTGTVPENAIDRLVEDKVVPPSAMGVKISVERETALMKGMAVLSRDRYQSLPELVKDLYSSTGGKPDSVHGTTSAVNEADKTIAITPPENISSPVIMGKHSRYRIEKQLSKDAFVEIYWGTILEVGLKVLIKAVRRNDPRFFDIAKRELQNEASVMSRFNHPSIPLVIDVIETSDSFFVVRQYMEGRTLDRVLKAQGAQPQNIVLEWAMTLAGAINYMHSFSPAYIHRDINPRNILITGNGDLVLYDFSIAVSYVPGREVIPVGTRGYAPPEQYSGKIDPRADIYGFGATLYYMLTGNDPAYLSCELFNITHIDSNIPKVLENIVIKCTRKNPADRYQSFTELIVDLNRYQAHQNQTRHRRLFGR